MHGVFGRYIDVDLTSRTTRAYEIPARWYTKYLGGRGIGLRILLEELKGGEDPLGPGNILVFSTGPLQGTGLAGAGRYAVVSKSPKTKTLNDSYVGGFLAHELGTSGFDGIIVRGRADRPVYLCIADGDVEIMDARDLWGLGVAATDRVLRKRHPGVRVLCIGPAGENLVKFACIISDISRAAGRPGFGAVMGSKNLKAIAVKGGQMKAWYDAEMLAEIRKLLVKELLDNDGIREFGKWGSSAAVLPLNEMGILPTKNFQEGVFTSAADIDGAGLKFRALFKGRDTCTGCPIKCKRVVSGGFKGLVIEKVYGGPEYETLAALGSNCLNSDLESICLANQLCNDYGLDTISVGVTIAWAMEASEKGLIKEKIRWGDSKTIVELIEKIAFRKGIGDMLARGIDELVAEIGGADFAMHIKGQELPMHDPRGKKSLALAYVITPRGGQHMDAMHDEGAEALGKYGIPEIGLYGPFDRLSWSKKARFCKLTQDLASFGNSAITCHYVGFDAALPNGYNPYPRFREAIYAATGLEIGVCEMLAIGERNFNLLKIAAALNGYTRKDDDLPRRFKTPLTEGDSSGERIPEDVLHSAIDECYKLRGWDFYGPTDAKLRDLGMEEFIELMAKVRDRER